MSAKRNSAGGRLEGTHQVVDGDPKEYKALGEFGIDGLVLEVEGNMEGNGI